MGKQFRRRQGERGATLIEFAFIAPLLLLLLFGVIEFSRVVHGYTTVWSAAREGARYATTVGDSNGNGTPNYVDCGAIIEASLDKVAGQAPPVITVTFSDRDGAQVADCVNNPPEPGDIENGYTIDVEASATFDAVVPLLGSFLDGIDLTSEQTRSIFKGIIGGQ